MGTEIEYPHRDTQSLNTVVVKLNNPLMGTEMDISSLTVNILSKNC